MKSNSEILEEIILHMIEASACTRAEARKRIRNMSIEDLGTYYEENCKRSSP